MLNPVERDGSIGLAAMECAGSGSPAMPTSGIQWSSKPGPGQTYTT